MRILHQQAWRNEWGQALAWAIHLSLPMKVNGQRKLANTILMIIRQLDSSMYAFQFGGTTIHRRPTRIPLIQRFSIAWSRLSIGHYRENSSRLLTPIMMNG